METLTTNSPQSAHGMGMGMPTVFIVDDEKPILELVRRVCASLNVHIQTFQSARAFLEVVDDQTPGCLIVDYDLPDLNGLEVLRRLDERDIKLPAIFISGKAELQHAVEAFRAGTLDFLEKPFDLDQLLSAVQRAIETDEEVRKVRATVSEISERIQRLTPRETQVLHLVVSGLANKEVASRLEVSPKTIEVHRSNVMSKMQADSLAHLVTMYMTWRGAERDAAT